MSSEKISYTEKEVEAVTGLRVKTLQAWRRTQQGPPWVRLGRRCVRYPSAELHQWVSSQPGGGQR
jgi:predicted DNA-binding transcriptional regulator AlpA